MIAREGAEHAGARVSAGELELIVASDGSTDATVAAQRRRRCKVLDLPRRGKVPTQDAAVDAATGEILAFSDANAFWDADALRELVRPVRRPAGRLRRAGSSSYLAPDGSNQEGAYWRYENWVRGLESRLGSVTAGNGAIYAVRREAYMRLDPRTSHDLSFPFNMVKKGWRAVYEPAARAVERPVPSIEGEFRRKRRMMSHAWPAVLGRRHAEPARLRPHVRARDPLAPRAALRDAVPARDRARAPTSRCWARDGCTR